MRTPLMHTPSPLNASANEQQDENQTDHLSRNLQHAPIKFENDDELQREQEVHSRVASPARPAQALPNRPTTDSRSTHMWRIGSRQQLIERTRNRIWRSHYPIENANWNEEYSARRAENSPQSDFAEEIENEAAEIRTLIARTAQLWSAVDQAEQSEATVSTESVAFQTLLPPQFDCMNEINDTICEDDEYEQESERGQEFELESADMARQISTFCTSDEALLDSLRLLEHRRIEHETLAVGSDHSYETTEFSEEGREDLQFEQGEIFDSNLTTNALKARAIQKSMLGNLVRLGFYNDLTQTALEAGVSEIDHYDADCELAYVDIFMSLVKMVCDAHVDVFSEQNDQGQATTSAYREDAQGVEANAAFDDEQHSFLPFKWPVFDMAQFEFAMDRTEELMEMLSCNLFCMLGDPIQVVIPSTNSSGRTKGHAFLEFDSPNLARKCASAIDGLKWGKGPFGQIRGNLFRHYQVKTPAEQQRYARDYYFSDNEGPASQLLTGIPMARYDERSLLELHQNRIAERFRPQHEHIHEVAQENLFCDSDDNSSDRDECANNYQFESAHFNPLSHMKSYTASIQQEEQAPLNNVVDWHIRASSSGDCSLHVSSEGSGDSYESSSALDLQALEGDKLLDNSDYQELTHTNSRCSSPRLSVSSSEAQAASSTVTSNASAGAHEAQENCGTRGQSWSVHDDQEGKDKPWRRYCEDLIVRNREMHKQLVFARRRVVQLSHNNQKLHLLVDRVERDRDGLLYENDVLQTQVHGYADHKKHHDLLMKELVTLRQRLDPKESTLISRTFNRPQHGQVVARHAHASFHGIQSALSYVSATVLTNCKIDELKDWEHVLETTLSHVRSAKEEKALEMQKKLDRQVEEQNELKLCVICLANDKTILCLPCRHLCLCKSCSRRQEVTKCPICRLEIDEMLAVYS
ncbi:ring zinc finger-containing protein [Plasmopara halstedii]|uniref:Ring zinc finger-containing protein n=1 Tax=Plasmopara halstedii TaxID=4781 RepID=A0A0P1B757_PLAHL|nr:ring zinc finger-containing protein [Plasmopara halstedii]CEG50377.1 ring zinc finger-containing protein [Plasmopara halstedii]|eukprot:XP_024586746.1 ring zinc finger-containing protein [Plasmopara halstedii]